MDEAIQVRGLSLKLVTGLIRSGQSDLNKVRALTLALKSYLKELPRLKEGVLKALLEDNEALMLIKIDKGDENNGKSRFRME